MFDAGKFKDEQLESIAWTQNEAGKNIEIGTFKLMAIAPADPPWPPMAPIAPMSSPSIKEGSTMSPPPPASSLPMSKSGQ